jgi:hypothetical protein
MKIAFCDNVCFTLIDTIFQDDLAHPRFKVTGMIVARVRSCAATRHQASREQE